MLRSRSLRVAILVCLASMSLVGGRLVAQDDLENTTPTRATWVQGMRGSDLVNLCQAQNLRITSIHDVRIGVSGRMEAYNAALVSNTGAYQKDWWLFENVNTAQVDQLANQLNARPISITSYDSLNLGLLHTVVMIRNTGPDYRVWAWGADLDQYVAYLTALQTNSRIISFARHGISRMAAVYVRNVGPTARNWRMFIADSVSNITAYAAQNRMRIVEWKRWNSAVDAILIEDPIPVAGWQLYRATFAQVEALRRQQKARVLFVSGGNDEFTVTLIDNANPLEQRFRNAFNARSDGIFGVRIAEVGREPEVDIYGDLPFEPAETMTTMMHLHAMRQVELGSISLRNLLPVNLSGRSCPNGTGTPSPSGLGTVLETMMEGNDLDHAYAVAPRRWSFSSVNVTAGSLGLRGTRLNHTIGCAGPTANVTTLEDLGSMHRIAGSSLSAANRDVFRSAMENSKNFPTWETSTRDLERLIADEATRRNLTLGRRIAFSGELEIAYKAGTYTLRNGVFVSEAGWISVPYLQASGTITRREYTFGAFNAGAGSSTAARGLVSDVLLEAVWPLVRDAMETWDDGGSGQYGEGCPGMRGTPVLETPSVPNIGTTAELNLYQAPFDTPAIFWLGLRLQNPIPIPGTTCDLHLQPLDSIPARTGTFGATGVPLPIPNDASLVGVRVAAQCSVLDTSANLLGFSFSNGLELRIGQ